MTNRPKAIGTAAETALVRYAQTNGFPGAERLALKGNLDEGDATLCPGAGVESKAGKAAESASDAQVAAWLAEAEVERQNRRADVMVLVLKRKGKGAANAGQWWAYLPSWAFVMLSAPKAWRYVLDLQDRVDLINDGPAVRITYAEALTLLRRAGYGDPLTEERNTA